MIFVINKLKIIMSLVVVLGALVGPILIAWGFYFFEGFHHSFWFAFLVALSLAFPFDYVVCEYYARKSDLSEENVDEYVEKILERTTGYYLSPHFIYEYDRKSRREKLMRIIDEKKKIMHNGN